MTTHAFAPGTGVSSSASKNVSLGKTFVIVNGSGGSGEPTTFDVVQSSRFSMPVALRSGPAGAAAGFASTEFTSPDGGARRYAATTNAATPTTDHSMPRIGRVPRRVKGVRTM